MKAKCIKRCGDIEQEETIEIQRDYTTNGVIYGYTICNHHNDYFLGKVLFDNHFKIMEDKSMNINEIAKEMTREEFLNKLNFYDGGKGCDGGTFMGREIICPCELDLFENCKEGSICLECWENAIKDIKFKREDENMKCANCGKTINKNGAREFCSCKCLEEYVGNDYNSTENKIDYDKKYSVSEAMKILENNKNLEVLSNYSTGNSFTVHEITEKFINVKFKFKRKEREVDFIEAIKEFRKGKDIKCIFEVLEIIYRYNQPNALENFEYGAITTDEILDGTWYVLN